MVSFEWVEPDYTGGGIFVFYGKVENGDYFIADDSEYDIRFVSEDPTAIMDSDTFGGSYCGDSVEWQDEHIVRDISSSQEALEFWKAMLNWCIRNNPDGNYSASDLKDELADVTSVAQKENW